MVLASKGYLCAKIWAFAPVIYSVSSSKLISFTDKKKLSPNGKIDWGYHVAPILQVKIGNKVRKMVIDPSLFPRGPVRYRTWLGKLKTRKLIYLIMDSDWYLFNSSIIPNSQLQINSDEDLQHLNKPNLKLPESFSNKLITDFFARSIVPFRMLSFKIFIFYNEIISSLILKKKKVKGYVRFVKVKPNL